MDQLMGTFNFDRNENFEAYLGTMGVPYLAKKMMSKTTPTIAIRREIDEWIIEIKTMVMNQTIKFKLDQPFEDSFPMGGGSFQTTPKATGEAEITLFASTQKGDVERTFRILEDELVM
ncbi:hypothetical protein TCAL_02334, partial [Tigriopus californicus]|eukprot:TCALIF_02334-PA protein Name:"Similar to Fabp12 Fatty acid-binding protein 12 (Mus musculus)" AED:0.50 eAED:0.50 QI:173/1/0.66/1/0/0/3/0/117